MVGQASRNGFTPPGAYPKITLPNGPIDLPWPDVMTHGEIDPMKLQANNEYLQSVLSENNRYLDRVELLQGTGTRWATIVIAASDSTALSKSTADFVCSGTSDDVIINRAIASLTSVRIGEGLGRIVLLEGTYRVTSAIGTSAGLAERHLVIQGMGSGGVGGIPATRVIATNNAACFAFNGGSGSTGSAITLMDIAMSNASSSAATINNRDMCLLLRDCRVVNTVAGAVNLDNSLGSSGGSHITNNYIIAAGAGQGIFADVGSGVDSPILIQNNLVVTVGGNAIECMTNISTVPSYVVTGNHCEGNNAAIGIRVRGNNSQDCEVVGNNVRFFATGIEMSGSRNVVAANMVSTCTTGVQLFGAIVTAVIANNIYNCTTGVLLSNNAQTPTVMSNKYSACTTGTTVNAGVTDAGVFFNDTFGCTTALNDSGTATRTESWFFTLATLPHHATTHEVGGVDPLTGLLDANARVGVRKNTAGSTFTRRRVNFIEGTNITITETDSSGNEEVNVTIAASGGGGGLAVKKNGSAVGTQSTLNVIEGSGVTLTVIDTGTEIDMTIAAASAVIGAATNMFNHLAFR